MALLQKSCSTVRTLPAVILVFSLSIGTGCDSSGTGSVKVQDRSKIQDKLTKGERPDKAGKAKEDTGVRFRKKD